MNSKRIRILLPAFLVLGFVGPLVAQNVDPFMGDWKGVRKTDDGSTGDLMIQVIALGNNQYRMRTLESFDRPQEPVAVMDAVLDGQTVRFKSVEGGTEWSGEGEGTLKDGKFEGKYNGTDDGTFSVKRVVRLSPTLGAKPPKGAIVLFDSKKDGVPAEWKRISQEEGGKGFPWKLVDGAMEVRGGSITTQRQFKDFALHLEFRTPFMPTARGQGRGNSGVYLQDRYEIQVLDSYGLEGLDNECGGIYQIGRPRVNACAPPMQWQTYDISFEAPRFDAVGKKVRNAILTVRHNGITIHDRLEVPRTTTAAPYSNETGVGGLYLQDHGNPVQFRNIWIAEKSQEASK